MKIKLQTKVNKKLYKKKNWNCKWLEIYKNPRKHDELVKYEDPKNLISRNILKIVDFKNKKVLDIGAGTGRITIPLSKKAKKIYALEIEEAQIKYLKKKKIKNIIPKKGSVEKIPFPKSYFDIVISTFALGHLCEKKKIQEIRRVLKPNGYLILADCYYTGEFIDIWAKYSDKIIKAHVKGLHKKILKLYPFKTKIIKTYWKFPSVKKAVDLLGYVLSGKVPEYLKQNKKEKINMDVVICYGVKYAKRLL